MGPGREKIHTTIRFLGRVPEGMPVLGKRGPVFSRGIARNSQTAAFRDLNGEFITEDCGAGSYTLLSYSLPYLSCKPAYQAGGKMRQKRGSSEGRRSQAAKTEVVILNGGLK